MNVLPRVITMRHIGILLLSLATLATAVLAAYYWFKSSRIPIFELDEPVASISDAPESHVLVAKVHIASLMAASKESSALNKVAALWTGVSALLGAITTVVGTLG
jgi:hypothetical protein